MDLTQILTPTFAMENFISGYYGSDTMPDCLTTFIWYLVETPFEISQKQLDYFKVDNVKWNNRNIITKNTKKIELYNAKGLFVK